MKNIPGKVLFFINDSCNYQCRYCFVNFNVKKEKLCVKNYKFFLKKIKKNIPKGWDFFILGGGEPFLHPDFFNIVKGLVDGGYLISINTNFSASMENLKKFFNIAGKKLNYFKASLHLEYSSPDIFINKIAELKNTFAYFTNFEVHTVALPKKMILLKQMGLKFKKENISFKLQLLKEKIDCYYPYSKKQQSLIQQINFGSKKNINFIKKINQKGKKCLCGYKYFVLSPNGDAFRCIPATQSKIGYLGNILENNFSLYKKQEICQEKSCFCFEKYSNFKDGLEISNNL